MRFIHSFIQAITVHAMPRRWCIVWVGQSWRSAVLKMLKPVCLAPQSTSNCSKITRLPVCLLYKVSHSNATHQPSRARNQGTQPINTAPWKSPPFKCSHDKVLNDWNSLEVKCAWDKEKRWIPPHTFRENILISSSWKVKPWNLAVMYPFQGVHLYIKRILTAEWNPCHVQRSVN